MGRGGGSRGGGGGGARGGARGGASSRPSSSSSSHTPAAPAKAPAKAPTPAAAPAAPATTPRSTTTPTKPAPPQQQTRASSTTAPAHAHAPQRSNAGSFMRSAMLGLGVGMLTSLGLHSLFGMNWGEGRALDVIAAISGAGATLGTAALIKNRALLRKQPSLPPALQNYHNHQQYQAPAFRPRFQMPRRYILWSVVGALGGIMVNSMRIESNRPSEIAPAAYPVEEGTNKWGDEAPPTTA